MDDLTLRLQEGLGRAELRRVRTRDRAPGLAYGRYRGPAPRDARLAAIAATFLRRPDGSWTVPLTLRPLTLRHHGGQVCFPGGRIEPGETPAEAALREFHEELGHLPVDAVRVGELEPLYVFASNNLIFPVIFTGNAPAEAWRPDPAEVDEVIEFPLDLLSSPEGPQRQSRRREIRRDEQTVGRYDFDAVAYSVDRHRVWGATALLLSQLGELLGERG